MKKWLSLLACLLLLCTLTGCGNDKTTTNSKEDSNNKVEENENDKDSSKNNEEKEESKNVVVKCSETEDWDEEGVESSTSTYVAEYDKAGNLEKFYAYYDIELTTTDKNVVEIYRAELEKSCEDPYEEYESCTVKVNGKTIRAKVEFDMDDLDEDDEIPTQEEFIDEFEDIGMTCTVK